MKKNWVALYLIGTMFCCSNPAPVLIEQWTSFEITLQSTQTYKNAYTDLEVWAQFISPHQDTMLRPGFWDGDSIWRVRFSPPDTNTLWSWRTFCSDPSNTGLHGKTGLFKSCSYRGKNPLIKKGLLRMSPGKRNVMHHNGQPFLVVGDTPWSLPFRSTIEQAKIYATDRQQKGFNTSLLMSVQPDMEAEGPEKRNTAGGFMRGFNDLSKGHINQLKPAYFQYLDSLTDVLVKHEIVPVFQPIFHGYGWKGKNVLGNHINPNEYVRYCKYLLARFGSKPAFWLLAGDNGGDDPGVRESGEMMEVWDCYQQPTGLHYNPCDDYVASWAIDNPLKHCEHYNKTHQAEKWLDFQWAQTGHGPEHLYHKVERMYEYKPTKASANGEPTYEGMNNGQNGLGWWQGEDAWMQLMSGGTMGVVYGAACLWQWKITAQEEGWPAWTDQDKSWKEAMQMEGSNFVGNVSKAFAGLDYLDMEKRPDLTLGSQPLLAKEGSLYISYLREGGEIAIRGVPNQLPFRWFNPKVGVFGESIPNNNGHFQAPNGDPWVLIVGH